MASLRKLHPACSVVVATALFCAPARALVTFNDGTDHLFVTGTASLAYDSNVYAHAGGNGDTIMSAGVLVEYSRRAGLIGVDASVGLNASRFGTYTSENFNNPILAAKFTKTAGRTTGALALGAARDSESDLVANVRVPSWNYNADLNFKYPVITRYSISGNLGYTDRVYDDTTVVSNLRTYAVGADLLYALASNRDLLAGYSFRNEETSSNTAYDDQSFTVGVTGRIFSKLSGSVRAGYQVRTPVGSTIGGDYKGPTSSASVTWTASQKLSFAGQIARDVTVTATNDSTDATSASLTGQYSLNDALSLSGNVGTGQNRFLDGANANRRDTFFSWGSGLNYTMNGHLKTSLTYAFYENWSTLSYSDFTRHTITLMLSSRW